MRLPVDRLQTGQRCGDFLIVFELLTDLVEASFVAGQMTALPDENGLRDGEQF